MTSSTHLFDGDMFATPGDATHFVGNVLESSTEYSLIATDTKGVIQLWNEGARRLHGHGAADVIGQPWTLLYTDDDGLLATAAIRDVTARRRTEKQLRDANVEPETANRAKDRFLASMSHVSPPEGAGATTRFDVIDSGRGIEPADESEFGRGTTFTRGLPG